MNLRVIAAYTCMTLLLFTGIARAQESTTTEGPPAPDASPSETTAEPADISLSSTSAVSPERESLKPLWIAGLISWSAVYLATILITIPVSEDEIRGLAVAYTLIPVAGPFIALGNDNDDLIVDPAAPLIVSGILQIVSVGMIIAGLAIKRDVKEKPLSFRNNTGSLQMSLAPAAFGRHGAGTLFTLSGF